MSSELEQADDDALQIQNCRTGDRTALAGLRDKFHASLRNILLARGANLTESEDLLADLWGDCVPGTDDKPSLLDKFSGKCSLQGWLATVATNRLIDLKRRQTRRGEVTMHTGEEQGTTFIQRVPAQPVAGGDVSLVELLRQCLQQAFAACPAEGLLMLRLVYIHGLSQRDLTKMWSCHEATISRQLAQTMSNIQTATMREIRNLDPWLELSWEDFLELCQTQQIGFL
jgi:RNA polymerase sigma factor (sigma-70 family)